MSLAFRQQFLNKPRKSFAGPTDHMAIKIVTVDCGMQVKFYRIGAVITGNAGKSVGRIYRPRSSDGNQLSALVQQSVHFVHPQQILAEKNDIRLQRRRHTATGT